METKDTLSVVTITLNEAHRLEQCYRSIAWADEWVVVDSGSSDGTPELARQLGARVYERPFDNFSNQKNSAIDRASGDWVFVLDADEQISTRLRREIETVIRCPNGADCYAVPRCNLHLGRWLRYGGQFPDWQIRLFRKGSGRFVHPIHEQVACEGSLGKLRHPLIHRSFSTLSDWIQKMDRQTSQEARFAFEAGRRASWFDVTVRPLFWFVRMYVAQRGFLDGWPGLIHSICTFVCIFFRHAKLRELHTEREGGVTKW